MMRVSTCGMSTGSCFWKMQDFMQSLQMRWPVAAHIGLSMVTDGERADGMPCCFRVFISEIFSSRGQPASGTPKTLVLKAPLFSLRPVEQLSFALVVALDAVVGLIESAGEIGTGIGELKTLPVPPVAGVELEVIQARGADGFHRNQVMGIELVRSLKQNAGAVLRLASRRERGPCGIACGEAKGFGMFGFVVQPPGDVAGEAQFGERLQQKRFQFAPDSEAINGAGLLLGNARDRFALDEFPLDGKERCKRVGALLKIANLDRDAEECADEVFEVRTDGDDQFGVLLCGNGVGLVPRDDQTEMEGGIARFQ